MRGKVLHSLAQAREHTGAVLPALLGRWKREHDKAARLGIPFAVAELLRSAGR
ncbi:MULTISPECIES: hypothetical protein [Actinosynnema]|uniref:hypothetical protein n=1 Tax=Actinosynnema TaxID=40566 RepID=UPI0020A5A172|nr:hypothetical protein [Actinosynnema pretiosum]MCP2097256.1 hypothetical protein [Actinosynnema pretiosum]